MWKDKLTEYNGKAITYDEIGNPLTYGTGDDQWSSSWEHGRQLAGLVTPEHTISYSYNADGLRTQKVVDGVQWEYVWDGDKLIYMYDGTAEWRFIYDAGGSIVGFMQGASTYYYKKNLQGDVISIFDNNFNEVVTYEYDSWGNLISQGGSKAAAYVRLGRDNPIRYRGYFYDTDTGLYYLQSRYYNADWGRFVNADGILISNLDINSMHNIFAYCSNNPINLIDPDGRCPCAWEAYCTCKDCPYYLKKIGKTNNSKSGSNKPSNTVTKKPSNSISKFYPKPPKITPKDEKELSIDAIRYTKSITKKAYDKE